MKLVVDAETDSVLGCHILGHDAGEIIQVVGDRREDGRDQGRFRRDHGAASERRRRTGDDADGAGGVAGQTSDRLRRDVGAPILELIAAHSRTRACAMGISIKNDEVEALARRLASKHGKGLTEIVHDALAREGRARGRRADAVGEARADPCGTRQGRKDRSRCRQGVLRRVERRVRAARRVRPLIVVDASAIVAMIVRETDGADLAQRLESRPRGVGASQRIDRDDLGSGNGRRADRSGQPRPSVRTGRSVLSTCRDRSRRTRHGDHGARG